MRRSIMLTICLLIAMVLGTTDRAASADSCSAAGTPVDASTDFNLNNTGDSDSPLLNALTPHCEREWVHEGKNTPKNKNIYLQANWSSSMPLPQYPNPKPANPSQNELALANALETECHKAHISAEFWVKSVAWRAIPSPFFKKTIWSQSGVWNDKTWTCSMPHLHVTVSSVEAVRVAAFASYGSYNGMEKVSKVSVYMQTL